MKDFENIKLGDKLCLVIVWGNMSGLVNILTACLLVSTTLASTDAESNQPKRFLSGIVGDGGYGGGSSDNSMGSSGFNDDPWASPWKRMLNGMKTNKRYYPGIMGSSNQKKRFLSGIVGDGGYGGGSSDNSMGSSGFNDDPWASPWKRMLNRMKTNKRYYPGIMGVSESKRWIQKS